MKNSKRMVRKDFDKNKPYIVDITGCTDDKKKEVQQAFFDIGCKHVYFTGDVISLLKSKVYANVPQSEFKDRCKITAQEFLNLVYEDDMKENKGHIHAHLMSQYAEDAMVSETPWEMWECFWSGKWNSCQDHPYWQKSKQYRRKPKTHIVNGVEIPDLRVKPKHREWYYLADPTENEFTYLYPFCGDNQDSLCSERGLIYQHTEEGRQAAILHAKAMLGIA